MEEPKIQKAEQIITEILLGSIYAASINVLRTIMLEPKFFDTIMAVNFSDLNDQFDDIAIVNPPELDPFVVASGSPSLTGHTYAEILHNAINGIVTVDNFTFRISSKLSTTMMTSWGP
jgi:hypothetical protein